MQAAPAPLEPGALLLSPSEVTALDAIMALPAVKEAMAHLDRGW